MPLRTILALAATALTCLVLRPLRARADQQVDALMLRFPAVSATQIAFEYDNDLWVAPRNGGTAVPLSSPPGVEYFPRFSADGKTIAFSAGYDGGLCVYTMPVTGGIPQRLTYDPWGDIVVGWSPDGRVVYASATSTSHPGSGRLYYASPTGGMPEALPMAIAQDCSFSPDGQWVAFTPWSVESRTWNRYQGGMAPDIWLFNLKTHEQKQITTHPGIDDIPMFFGTQVYYLTDMGPEHRRNIWVYDTVSGKREQVTHFTEFETKYPSAGPDCIVLENGGKLYLLDIATHKLTEVHITLPGDRKNLRPETLDVSHNIAGAGVSPSGKRIVVEARGDIWTLPAEHGFPRNLTASCGVADRDPAWSPDGKWIACFSDESGEYELYLRPSDGNGAAKQLTHDLKAFLYNPIWSPDSKWIAYSDKSGALFVISADGGDPVHVDSDPWSPQGVGASWSPDSRWLTYAVSDNDTGNSVLKIYDMQEHQAHQVTSAMYSSSQPVFSASGKFLFFVTSRHFQPQFSDVDDGEDFLFNNSDAPALMPLTADTASPFAPENDEEAVADAGKDKDKDKDKDKKPDDAKPADSKAKPDDKPAPDKDQAAGKDAKADQGKDGAKPDDANKVPEVKIDFDGLEARSIALPVEPGGYGEIGATPGHMLYVRGSRSGAPPAPPALYSYDFAEKKEDKVFDNVGWFDLTKDRSHALVNVNGQFMLIGTSPGPPPKGAVSTAGMLAQVDPRTEWHQVVHDAWRIYRDFYYDPGMHKVDWAHQLDRAEKLVDSAASREDVNYIISEMVSELNSSHTYVWSRPTDQAPDPRTGLLGCDFETAQDAAGHQGVRISHIYRGAAWDFDVRSPLCDPDVNVKTGDFLLAIDGVPVSAAASPYALLQGKADQVTKLTVGPNAVKDDKARDVLVKPLGDDGELRLRDWIEANRQYVDKQSGGKVGYIYVRNTGWEGLIDLQRQFEGQFRKDGLVIDERWNGGGMIPYRFVELLNRPTLGYFARRDGHNWRVPWHAHDGPKVMLINGHAGSGGDAFPYFFREVGLGKLVGERTWGGLIGISSNPRLIDGSGITVPDFGFYKKNGTWGIEGHGVDPDIVVQNDPAALAAGKDPQLDAGLKEVMEELKTNTPHDVPKPPYPDRSGVGVRPEDI
jgi:tricorn protease